MNNIVEKEIDGILYKASYKGFAFSSLLDEQFKDDKSNLSLGEILFSEVLISPKVDIDDFTSLAAYIRVRDFLLEVASGNYQKKKSDAEIRRKVKEEWGAWRLVYCDMANFTFDEVFHRMTPQEIKEANIALDLIQAELKKQSKKK